MTMAIRMGIAALLLMQMTATAAGATMNADAQNGETLVQDAVEQVVADTWENQKPLRAFARKDAGRFVYLRQSEAEFSLPLPVPLRIRPEQLHVHLVFTNSNALLAERSQIRLGLNGGIFAQAALDPRFPDGVIDVDVPLQLVQGGLNRLSIEVAQHYKSVCEDPGSPELWTSVDLDESYVRLAGALAPIAEDLSQLNDWLKYSSWDSYHVAFAPLFDDAAHLKAGGLLAQGLALRAGDQSVVIDQVRMDEAGLERTAPESDLVVFGTYAEFERLLGKMHAPSRARISLSNRSTAGRILLLVAGRTPDDLVDAAAAFAAMRMPLGRSAALDIDRVVLPDPAGPVAPHAVVEGRSYRFSDLGFSDMHLAGLADESRIRLWMPPDLFASEHMLVDLKLHFSYGAALRADSVLNVYHNGTFLRGISLGDPRGLMIRDYLIRIPLHQFRPGINEFRFESRMHALTTTNCTTGNTDNLKLSIFADSSITVPAAEHYLAMPNLNVTMNTGYPYLGDDGKPVAIHFRAGDPDLISAAWTLAARLAQLRGMPIPRLEIGPQASATNRIELAALKDVEADLWHRTPVDLGRVGEIQHPLLANPAALGEPAMSVRQKLKVLLASEEKKREAANYTAAVRQSFQLQNLGVLMQMQAGEDAGTLSLLVADSNADLRRAVERLVRLWPEMHDVQGDVLVWGQAVDAADPDYWSAAVSNRTYYVGTMPYLKRVEYFAVQYPLFLLGLLLVLFVFMSLLSRWLLLGYRRKAHPDAGA